VSNIEIIGDDVGDDGGDDARDAAAMRWKGIEAFNYAPRLTPAARRVGMALICNMDSRTRACFPSELRLAGLLDLTRRAVSKAKAELFDRGLINWSNEGGPRHMSRYGFNWEALDRLSQEAKARAKEAVENADRDARSSHKRERQFSFGKERPSTLETPEQELGSGKREFLNSKRELLAAQRERQFLPNENASSPELSHYPPTITTHSYHDALARDVTAASASPCHSTSSSKKEDVETEASTSGEQKSPASSQPVLRPPSQNSSPSKRRSLTIWEALSGNEELILKLMNDGHEEEAQAILNRDGAEHAFEFIRSLG
jgi:hypothetical protein